MLGIQGEYHPIKSPQQPLATQPGIVNLTSGKKYNTEPRLDFSRFAHVFPSSA